MVTVVAETLTKESFEEYGTIISPDEEISRIQNLEKGANQGTAIKLLQVSQVENKSTSKVPNWNLFRCFPQPHLNRVFTQGSNQGISHSIKVLNVDKSGLFPISLATTTKYATSADVLPIGTNVCVLHGCFSRTLIE